MKTIISVCLIIFIFGFCDLKGQDSTQIEHDSTMLYKVYLQDGSKFVGKILYEDSQYIILRTESIQKIEIKKEQIKKIVKVDESNLEEADDWFENPNSTRYLFGPSGYNLKKGEGYYQNTLLFLNSFNVGVTDFLSLGGGIEFISTFSTLANGDFDPIFFITPKVGFEITHDFNAGLGILYVSLPFSTSDEFGFGIAYGVATYGSPDHNITGGLGWGYIEDEFSEKPIIMVAGMTRISRKTALVTENWFVPSNDYYAFFSYGIRFFGEQLAVDLAFVNSADIAEWLIIGIPYVNFTVKF